MQKIKFQSYTWKELIKISRYQNMKLNFSES